MKISENYIGDYPFIKIEEVKDFDVGKIFDCGQCFRWSRNEDGSYTRFDELQKEKM